MVSHLNDCKLFCPNDLGSTDVHGGFLTFLHFYSSVALALAHTLTRTLDARSRARRNKQTGKNTVKPANNGLLGKWTGDGRGTKELNTGIVASSGKLRPVRTGMGSRKHVTPSRRKCEVHTRTCSKNACLFVLFKYHQKSTLHLRKDTWSTKLLSSFVDPLVCN